MADTSEKGNGDRCNNPGHGQDHEQELPVADLLKDQFGDYSDPLAYDWSWREGE
jgi:hypothetical protein